MKQHITVEQMKEIEDKTLAKYMPLEFTHSLEAVCYYGAESATGIIGLNKMAEMITIGKMIEILKSKGVNWFEVGYPEIKETREKKVFIKITKDLYFWGDNLCDALWEAVKYVLEESE